MGNEFRALGFGLVALAQLAGCGTTATISRGFGQNVEGRIEGGTADSVLIKDSDSGSIMSVPRSEIRDIDHPGNVATTFGGILTGYGLVNIAVGYETCQDGSTPNQGAYCTGLFTPLAAGIGLLIYGIIVYTGSTGRAADVSSVGYYPSEDPLAPMSPAGQPPPPFAAPAAAPASSTAWPPPAAAPSAPAAASSAPAAAPSAPASPPSAPASPPSTPASPPSTPASPPSTPASPPSTPASPPSAPAATPPASPQG